MLILSRLFYGFYFEKQSVLKTGGIPPFLIMPNEKVAI